LQITAIFLRIVVFFWRGNYTSVIGALTRHNYKDCSKIIIYCSNSIN
jgi:hypothetical protein